MKGITFGQLDGSNLHIGIVRAKWNDVVTGGLFEGCENALLESNVKKENIYVLRVPGSFEVVAGAKFLLETQKLDAIVCLGALIKGETMHFEFLGEAVAKGIMELNTRYSTPVIFGVLTCFTEDQAIVRSSGENNHGIGWGLTAVEMGLLRNRK